MGWYKPFFLYSSILNGKSFNVNFVIGIPSGKSNQKAKLIGEFGKDKGPKLCMQAYDSPDFVPTRPCRITDQSYVTSSSDLHLK